MPRYADRVKETSTSTGTGNITLAGAVTGFITFNSAFGFDIPPNAVRFRYVIEGGTTSEWEVGVGYLSAAATLVREEVLESSNSDALVSFSSGTQTVFNALSAFHANRRRSLGSSMLIIKGNFLP
jgi:hypothetical protein